MSRRRVVLAVVLFLIVLAAAFSLSPARVIVANVDGPTVSVEVVGFARVSVACPGTQTIWVPLLRVMPRDVVVTDTRTGLVLRRTSVSNDTVVLVRRDGVLTGPPGSSYGPAPINGCLSA